MEDKMQIVFVLIGMVAVGLLIGWLAGPIWKGNRPYGTTGDNIAAIVTAVAVALIDWYVIPAMGFSDQLKYIGVAVEPALSALIVLWIMRLIKK